jgi:O-antigen ligase/tetratricopeptide (TPR) repeat protein
MTVDHDASIKQNKWRWLGITILIPSLLGSILAGGYIWRGNYWLQWGMLIFATVLITIYLIRRVIQRGIFPITSLEWVFLFCTAAILLSWIFSPDFRQGLWRVASLFGYLLLFYILVDAYRVGLNRNMVIRGVLITSGILLILALLETYVRYTQWWAEVGSWVMPPYPYRFTGLLGHSNALMGLANLCAPLAIVATLKSGKRVGRFLAVLWLVIYLLAIPFSSSRGGWVGLAGWVGAFLLIQAIEGRWWRWLERFRGKTWTWILLGIRGMVILGAVGWVAYRLWILFAAHPSHGGNPFGGRTGIWYSALKVWLSSPWVGVGPGRFAFDFLRLDGGSPPAFWAVHAHSLPIQILAEFGVLGFIALIFLLVVASKQIWKQYQYLDINWKMWGKAILVGVAGWLFQMMVDDQSMVWGEIVILVFLLAWMFMDFEKKPTSKPILGVWILGIPVIVWLAVGWWSLNSYRYVRSALELAAHQEWSTAALTFDEAIKFDPTSSYYPLQAGLAYSKAWEKTPLKVDYLREAMLRFHTSLEKESSLSLWWADYGMLAWQNGESEMALQLFEKARQLAQNEPSYPLNSAWCLEQLGRLEEAQVKYLLALELAPQWADHPYWQTTNLRKQVYKIWKSEHPTETKSASGELAYWQQARQAVRDGSYKEAVRLLAYARWVGDPSLEILLVEGDLARAEGRTDDAVEKYQQIADQVPSNRLQSVTNFALTYSLWLFNREGLVFDLVPGYLQLTNPTDHLEALILLSEYYGGQGDCERARYYLTQLEFAVRGGSLEQLPMYSECPLGENW